LILSKSITPLGTLASAISDEGQHALTESGVYEARFRIQMGPQKLSKEERSERTLTVGAELSFVVLLEQPI
jgi:hypothetical protein